MKGDSSVTSGSPKKLFLENIFGETYLKTKQFPFLSTGFAAEIIECP
jgi:hypothetical protein